MGSPSIKETEPGVLVVQASQESEQSMKAKAEFGRAVLMLYDLVDWLQIIERSCPLLLSGLGQKLVDQIKSLKLSLNELQAMRLEPYSESGAVAEDLYIYLGINFNPYNPDDNSDQRVYANLKGFPAQLAGEFIEFVRHSEHIVQTIKDFFNESLKPELAKIYGFDINNVFCNFERDDPNIPSALDPDWK